VAIELVFETHSTTEDNEQGRATGWLPGQLSERGRMQAQQLGRRRTGDGITAVFSSDLARAAQTASVAFAGSAIPVLYDWRLRECDYGQRNGMPVAELQPGGASIWTSPTRAEKAGGTPLRASAASSPTCPCAGTGSES
jgi:2,3-bisphosphoglycerate-dependent phosphoglycerate mutase